MKYIFSILIMMILSSGAMAQNISKSLVGKWLWTETKQQTEGLSDDLSEALTTEMERNYYSAPAGLVFRADGTGYFMDAVDMKQEDIMELFYSVKGNELCFSQVPSPSEDDQTYLVKYLFDGENLVLEMDFTERIREKLENPSIEKVQLQFYFAKEELESVK